MTEEERQNYLIASEKLLDRLKGKETLHFFGDVVAQAAEHMVFVLDELEDEELKESYRLIVGLTTVFKVGKEHFEKLVQWETELAERIKARGLKNNNYRPQDRRATKELGCHKGGDGRPNLATEGSVLVAVAR
jgi:hypothetical protein